MNILESVQQWYMALSTPLKVVFWLLLVGLGLGVVKRLLKVVVLVTILIVIIFVIGFYLAS